MILRKTTMTQMVSFLDKYYPLPTEEQIKELEKKKPRTSTSRNVKLLSLQKILEQLMNKCLESPEDPYINNSSPDYWPPYIELLLRNSIALRHP